MYILFSRGTRHVKFDIDNDTFLDAVISIDVRRNKIAATLARDYNETVSEVVITAADLINKGKNVYYTRGELITKLIESKPVIVYDNPTVIAIAPTLEHAVEVMFPTATSDSHTS